MKQVIGLLQFNFLPASVDLGLLVLRVWIGACMLILHGITKIKKFEELTQGFADPFGLGPKFSLILAIFAEVVCAALLVLGLLTRFAALSCVILMAVAFSTVHKMALSGPMSGELAFIYMAGFVMLLITGGGRFSLDAAIARGLARSEAPEKKA